jgi:hypothetical protein
MSTARNIITLSQSWRMPHKYVNAVKQVFGGHINLDQCSKVEEALIICLFRLAP